MTTQTHPVTMTEARAKVSRYKWADVKDLPGRFAMVRVSDLSVDHSYQRDLNPGQKRVRMAAQFSLVACGCLTVGERDDGTLVVLDGQHRLEAVKSRGDIRELPCLIFQMASTHEEAASFLATNVERQPLKTHETFKAMLSTGDPIATELSAMFRGCGRTPSKGEAGHSVDCVGACVRAMRMHRESFLTVWPILTQLCVGTRLDSRLVTGLTVLESRLHDDEGKRSMSEKVLRDRLLSAGYTASLRYVADACAFYHRGGDGVFARGLLNLLNHKARIRLKLVGQTD